MYKLSKQIGEKFRILTEKGGFLRQMGPRKLSKNRAEYRIALLNGEEPYDYPDDPVSPEATAAVDAAIDAYIATQETNIGKQEAKIETEQANIQAANNAYDATVADLDAQLEAGTITQEEYDAAVAAAATTRDTAVTKAEKNIATAEKNIATYQDNIAHADTKVTTVTIEDIPELLTLEPTNYKMTIKGDFSANETTTVEANAPLTKDTQIQNTGEPANVVIDLGNSNANLAGQWDEVTVKSVGLNSLTIAVGAHVNKLIVKRGHVIVKNALIEDNVDEYVVEGEGVLESNGEIIASKAGDFYNNPATVVVKTPLTFSRITSGILTMGHFIYQNNARVDFTTATGTAAGFMLRGAKLLAEFYGEGEWHSANNPCIWLTDVDGVIKIHDGKFFNDANHSECIYAEKGHIEIYGGEFHNVDDGEKNFLINCKDDQYTAGNASIVVYGGKFYGFDPAHNDTNPGGETNYVAEGYESVYHEEGDYYEVVRILEPEPEGE